MDRSAALKALLTWVDLGVLKEDVEGTFRLLEVTEEPSSGPSEHARSSQFSHYPPFPYYHLTISHCHSARRFGCAPRVECAAATSRADESPLEGSFAIFDSSYDTASHQTIFVSCTVHRRNAYEPWATAVGPDTVYAQIGAWV